MNFTDKHIFPAGEYVISDPCYVIRDEYWDDLIEKTGCFGLETERKDGKKIEYDEGIYTLNNHTCFAYGTVWGDGLYSLQKYSWRGNPVTLTRIGVDAGMIGIMPLDAVTKFSYINDNHLCYKFVIKDCFDVFVKNGIFFFGYLFIDTN